LGQDRSRAENGKRLPIGHTLNDVLGLVTRAYGRLVGLIFALVGVWVLIVNLSARSYSGWVLVWILAAGLAGAAGGVLYLLSFDGPVRFRNRTSRLLGWGGMVFLSVLPTSLILVLFPMVLLAIPTLYLRESEATPPAEPTA
jgi:hypothetical protein